VLTGGTTIVTEQFKSYSAQVDEMLKKLLSENRLELDQNSPNSEVVYISNKTSKKREIDVYLGNYIKGILTSKGFMVEEIKSNRTVFKRRARRPSEEIAKTGKRWDHPSVRRDTVWSARIEKYEAEKFNAWVKSTGLTKGDATRYALTLAMNHPFEPEKYLKRMREEGDEDEPSPST